MADGEERKEDKIAKVLVFAPPQICFHQPNKRLRIDPQESQDCWEKTNFNFSDGKFVKPSTRVQSDLQNTSTTEESCIFLEYDPKLVQESVNSYLDQVFSEPSCSPFVSNDDSCCVQNKSEDNLSETSTELQKEYDTVSYESQALLDSIMDKEDSSSIKEKRKTLKIVSTGGNKKHSAFNREGKKMGHKTSLLCFEDTHPMSDEDVYTQQTTQDSETNNIVEDIQAKESREKDNIPLPSTSSLSSLPSSEPSFKLSNRQSSSTSKDQNVYQTSAMPSSLSSSEVTNEKTPLSSVKRRHSQPNNEQPSLTNAQSLQRSSSESSDSKSSTEASSHQIQKKSRCLTLPKIFDKLSNLSDCTPGKDLVNICIIVLQVNPIKEIQIKSGRNAGQFIPLSSIIVSDITRSHFKLTLWRQASSWTEKLIAGDTIVATAIRIEKWRDEYIGQTTFSSSFYNLHQPQKPLSDAWLQIVRQSHLDAHMSWAKNVYGHLFRKTPSKPTVRFVGISELQNNTLVHFRGMLKSVCALTDKSNRNTYKFGAQRLPKIRAVFAQSPQEETCVTLWGRQSDWLESLRKSEGSVFELRYLTAKHDNITGNIVLHTTSKSTKNKLDSHNEEAEKILSTFKNNPVDVKTFSTIKRLLQAKFNGCAEISGNISSLILRYENEALEVESHNVEALKEWCNRLTYVGCASCARALKQDKNGIYGQCIFCVSRKPGHTYALRRYFRNVTVRIQDRTNMIDAAVNHKAACKLLEGMNPDDFCQDSSGMSLPKAQELVDVVKELLTRKASCRFVLSCKTVVDENSFVVSRNFELIDY